MSGRSGDNDDRDDESADGGDASYADRVLDAAAEILVETTSMPTPSVAAVSERSGVDPKTVRRYLGETEGQRHRSAVKRALSPGRADDAVASQELWEEAMSMLCARTDDGPSLERSIQAIAEMVKSATSVDPTFRAQMALWPFSHTEQTAYIRDRLGELYAELDRLNALVVEAFEGTFGGTDGVLDMRGSYFTLHEFAVLATIMMEGASVRGHVDEYKLRMELIERAMVVLFAATVCLHGNQGLPVRDFMRKVDAACRDHQRITTATDGMDDARDRDGGDRP